MRNKEEKFVIFKKVSSLPYLFILGVTIFVSLGVNWGEMADSLIKKVKVSFNPASTAEEYVENYRLEKFAGISFEPGSSDIVNIYGTAVLYDSKRHFFNIELSLPDYQKEKAREGVKLKEFELPQRVKVYLTGESTFYDPFNNSEPEVYSLGMRGDESPILDFLGTYVAIRAEVREGKLMVEEIHTAVVGR